MTTKPLLMDEKVLKWMEKPFVFITFFMGTTLLCVMWNSLWQFTLFSYFFWLSIYTSLKLQVKHRKFMQKFAEDRGFMFFETVSIDEVSGKLFSKGTDKKIKNIIKGLYDTNEFRIFNYSYRIGTGKNSTTYMFTVCDVEIKNTQFPHILLSSKTMEKYSMLSFFDTTKVTKIKLENDLDNFFTLHCSEGYEIEALQIFTPELLDTLKKSGHAYSIEFSENNIYFYDDLILRKEPELDLLYLTMKNVIDHAGPLLHRLHDDFDALHQYSGKNFGM